MAWEQRGTEHYYYRSRKKQGRIIRQYYGKGILAERAALEDAERRAEHDRERTERQHIQALDTETQSLFAHDNVGESSVHCCWIQATSSL